MHLREKAARCKSSSWLFLKPLFFFKNITLSSKNGSIFSIHINCQALTGVRPHIPAAHGGDWDFGAQRVF